MNTKTLIVAAILFCVPITAGAYLPPGSPFLGTGDEGSGCPILPTLRGDQVGIDCDPSSPPPPPPPPKQDTGGGGSAGGGGGRGRCTALVKDPHSRRLICIEELEKKETPEPVITRPTRRAVRRTVRPPEPVHRAAPLPETGPAVAVALSAAGSAFSASYWLRKKKKNNSKHDS